MPFSDTDSAKSELTAKCSAGEAWACIQLDFLNKPQITAESEGAPVAPEQKFADGGYVAPIDLTRPNIGSKREPGKGATEETITVPFAGIWINIPTIVDGKRVSEEDALKLMKAGKNEPTGMFKTIEEAVNSAVERSKQIGIKRDLEMSDGGQVLGAGTGTSDSIDAKLSNGEFVFTAKAVKQIGLDRLQSMMDQAEKEFDQADTTDQQMQQLFPK